MENKSIPDLIINLLGLGILLWLVANSMLDLMKGTKHRTLSHNLLIICISLIYSVKIILKDLLGIL